jgi:hypothetical protein
MIGGEPLAADTTDVFEGYKQQDCMPSASLSRKCTR